MFINNNIQPVRNVYNSENTSDQSNHRQFNRVLEQYLDYVNDHQSHQRFKSHMAGLHRQQNASNQQQNNQKAEEGVVDNVVLTHEMLELKLAREANSKMPHVDWNQYDYPDHFIDSNA